MNFKEFLNTCDKGENTQNRISVSAGDIIKYKVHHTSVVYLVVENADTGTMNIVSDRGKAYDVTRMAGVINHTQTSLFLDGNLWEVISKGE